MVSQFLKEKEIDAPRKYYKYPEVSNCFVAIRLIASAFVSCEFPVRRTCHRSVC
jgi:hypothetical protein